MTMRAQAARKPIEQRRSARDLVDYSTTVQTLIGVTPLRVINLSPLGLMGRSKALVAKGERLRIALPHVGAIDAEVRWSGEDRIGVEFTLPIDERDYALLLAAMPGRDNGW